MKPSELIGAAGATSIRLRLDALSPDDGVARYLLDRLTGEQVALEEARLLAPVIPRSKLVGVGRNYAEHAAEMGNEVPEQPLLFLMPNTSVIASSSRAVASSAAEAIGTSFPPLRFRSRFMTRILS